MRWLLMILAAVAVFLWVLPLRLVAPARVPGLEAQTVSGSVWNGRLEGARYRGVELGDLDVQVDPLSLLTGRPALEFQRRSPFLAGRISGDRQTQRVAELRGELLLPLLPRPLPATVIALEHVSISMGADGCEAAAGQVNARLPELPVLGGARLAGVPQCEGPAVLVPLRAERTPVAIDLRLWPDGRWQADVHARPGSPTLAGALQALGFTGGQGGFSLRIAGQS